MPVSRRKKHPKKRTRSASLTAPSGFVANITYGGFDIPGGIVRAFHQDGRRYYNRGREDRANGAQLMPRAEFMSIPMSPMPDYLGAFEESVRESQYAQYLDGYEGRPFYDRVSFKRDDI